MFLMAFHVSLYKVFLAFTFDIIHLPPGDRPHWLAMRAIADVAVFSQLIRQLIALHWPAETLATLPLHCYTLYITDRVRA